jgi:two-component system sensor histidine kinase YesM
MKKWIKKSFHRQLLFCFAVVALFPLLLFGVSLIQTMETKINSDYEKRVTEQAEQIDAGVLHLFKNFEETVESINANSKIVGQINEEDSWSKSKIYLQFYREVSGLREYAQVDLYDKTGKCIYTTAQGNAGTDLPVYWGILKAVEESEENLVLRRAEPNDKDILMYAAGKLLGKENTLEGYIVIGMRAENFEKLLYDNGNSKAEVAFLDTYWRMIFESGNLQTDKIREELMKGHKLLGVYRAGELLIEPLGNTGLYTVMACPSVFSTEVLNSMYSVLTVMLIISILLCVGVASHVGRNMTRPVERMNTAMRTLQEGDLTVRIASDREDELGQMSRNFNIMANELEQNVQEKIEKQKELNASHIAMMQAQLNPHFLYNTLDTMKWVAKANHIPEIATMAAGLAKILRTSISKRQFIYLKEELELVNCYVDIQKIRFNDKFSYTVDLQEGLEECVIPKLIIQPIVENSVLHGLKESEEGNILVRITGQEDVLCIEVTDDGCGAPEERIDAINHRRQEQLVGHIGVSNVDTIIRLTYGEEYGIHMERLTPNVENTTDGQRTEEEGEVHGTKVTLRLPVRYGEA